MLQIHIEGKITSLSEAVVDSIVVTVVACLYWLALMTCGNTHLFWFLCEALHASEA